MKPLLRALRGEVGKHPPIWLMRQAGRYLPEYRALREKAGSFLELCLTPEMATEITLQPIRRFGLDAAILFSDILVIPHALGQAVSFEEGVGPRLEALESIADLEALRGGGAVERLGPVMETVGRLKEALPDDVTLIGFAGAPWTVASYMVEGGSSRDYTLVKRWAYGDPGNFQALIDLLVATTVDYLDAQVTAGAEVVQVFDSWASVLPARALERWSLEPIRRIVAGLKERHPDVPVIVFPRAVGVGYAVFAERCGADALSLDSSLSLDWAREALGSDVVLQGNLDPVALLVGGEALQGAAGDILEKLEGRPFIFNLGHGVLPQTPLEHVAELVARVRGGRV